MAETVAATFFPLATAATARMSSMRPLVHEPMNTSTQRRGANRHFRHTLRP